MTECITNLRINSQGALQYSKDNGCHWVTVGMVQGQDGQDGTNGTDGTNGVTPHINMVNKHWVIGVQDTGIVAEGKDGDSPYINQDGYWVVEGIVTQYKAIGDTYDLQAAAGVNIETVGTPTVTASRDDVHRVVTFTFNYLKGTKGDTPALTATQTPTGYDIKVGNDLLCSLTNGQDGQDGEDGADGDTIDVVRDNVNNKVSFYVNNVLKAELFDGIRYSAGDHINIDEDNKINCTLTAGEGIHITDNDEIEADVIVPTVKNELIYSEDNETLTTHQLMYQDALVVDTYEDYLFCTSDEGIETDILGAWQQFQTNANHMPEYGTGLYIPGSGYGYGMWYSDGNGGIKNSINSVEFNGYILPYSRNSYSIESLFGTNSGNTTGDQIGFSIVNDSNASARHFSTDGGVYYRNTLYDIYPSGSSSTSVPRRPELSAWVSEDIQSGTAKVIYTNSPTTSGSSEDFPSGSVSVYTISNIKTSAGRRNKPSTASGTETVVANSGTNAAGYISFLNVIVTNSDEMQAAQFSGTYTGTIYVFGSIYNIATKQWTNVNIINGSYNERNTGNYWERGHWLVPYDPSLNTSSNAAVQKSFVSFSNGILTMRFGNPIAFSSAGSAAYNGSELKINFKTRTYDFTPYTGSGKEDKTGISLPTFTSGITITDKNGNTVNPDLWGMFAGSTKFMYNAFSYQNLYIKCLDFLLDNLIFYTDKTSPMYGVYGLNAARTAYERKYVSAGVPDDPLNHFGGSRLSHNSMTNKLFYNDGTSIYRISASPVGYTWDPTTSTFAVAGQINASQGFFQTSDIRKKNVVGDISLERAYDLVDKCQDILYTLKDSNLRQVGMIAQEVQQFFPEIISIDKYGYLSIDYSRLTVIILRVLKDVLNRIKELESKYGINN